MATLILQANDEVKDIVNWDINDIDVVLKNYGHTTEIIKGPFIDNIPYGDKDNHLELLEEFMNENDLWDRFEEFIDKVK